MIGRERMDERILITGAGGMLGREVAERLKVEGCKVTATDLQDLNIADPEACYKSIEKTDAQIVINCAAYTQVDKAEEENEKATEVNGNAPGFLAIASKKAGALLIHYSTDYVFDGTKDAPYLEDDQPSPLSAYGRSKLEGEKQIQSSGCRHLIIRTEWLFGKGGSHFIRSIVNAAAKLPHLDVVNDQFGSPTYAYDTAEATAMLIRAGAEGIVHFTSSGSTSWFDFTKLIFAELGISKEVRPMSTDKLNRPAKRPSNSRLDCSKYVRITGKTPPPYEDALRRYLKTGDL